MFGKWGGRQAKRDQQVWLLGNAHPGADRSIGWDDGRFPNLSDPDALVVDLTTLTGQVMERIGREKLDRARPLIRDKILNRGTVVVITQPFDWVDSGYVYSETDPYQDSTPQLQGSEGYSNYQILPTQLITKKVPSGTRIVADPEHNFKDYIDNVRQFSFYIESYHPKAVSGMQDGPVRIELTGVPGQEVNDNAGHCLGLELTAVVMNHHDMTSFPYEGTGRLVFLPPPSEPMSDAIERVLSALGKASHPGRPAPQTPGSRKIAHGPHEDAAGPAPGSGDGSVRTGVAQAPPAGPGATVEGVSDSRGPASWNGTVGHGSNSGAAGAGGAAGPAEDCDEIDVFLSYSHEVKETVAMPLAEGLKKRGITVWWDDAALRISDPLHQKIKDGLDRSRHGVVIVSRGYLDSDWGKTELGAMFGKGLPIFPILYGVSAGVAQKSLPAISGKMMGTWDNSPEFVMNEIASAIKDSRRGRADQRSAAASTPQGSLLPTPGGDGSIGTLLAVDRDLLISRVSVVHEPADTPTGTDGGGFGPDAVQLLRERNILSADSTRFAQNEHFTRLHSPVPNDEEKPAVLFTACPHNLAVNADVASEEFVGWAKSITAIEVDGQRIGVQKIDHTVDVGSLIFAKIRAKKHQVRRALLYREFKSTGLFEYGTSDMFFAINRNGRLEMDLCHMIGHFWAFLVHVRLFYKKIGLSGPFTVLLSIGNSHRTELRNDGDDALKPLQPARVQAPPACGPVTHRNNIQFSHAFGSVGELTDESIALAAKKAAKYICNAYGETTPNCYSDDGVFSWARWRHASQLAKGGRRS